MFMHTKTIRKINTIVFRIRKCEFHGSFVWLPDNIMDIKNDTSSPEGTVQALIQ